MHNDSKTTVRQARTKKFRETYANPEADFTVDLTFERGLTGRMTYVTRTFGAEDGILVPGTTAFFPTYEGAEERARAVVEA